MCDISLDELRKRDPRGWFVHQVQLWVTDLACRYGFGEKFQCGSGDILRLWEKLNDRDGQGGVV